ncbi:MAG TPA: GDSL-type esterase/lipase family protein [Stellaceae bacterium]|nr:GDSL-type esterase/lipase family protein [Stellaceae bacterium]
MHRLLWLAVALSLALSTSPASAQSEKWVASWTGSVQGPYPVGNPSAQPDLRAAFPAAQEGARDQTFRLIVRPDIWGREARLRFSNVFGARPLTLDGVFAGVQLSGAAIIPGTNAAVRFGHERSVTIQPGKSVWSDPIRLSFVRDANAPELAGRKLAVSFHVAGASGPMTWHAKALTTSYLTPPGAGAQGQWEAEAPFPLSTTSWYFLDAVEVKAPYTTRVVVAFGDSITDGTASTLNGDDRWPDVLSRRLHAKYGGGVAVVNAGIGGNQVVGPSEYSVEKPFAGGPAARDRLERDVLSLSGVSTVIWLEGINDFSKNGNAEVASVEAGMRDVTSRIRARISGVRVIGATVTSALGANDRAHGSPEQDQKRKALNDFIRHTGLFDGVADFDQATVDAKTGELRAEFVPDSTTGTPGDKRHPNRAGYLAMGNAIDLGLVMGERGASAKR